ncbi:hypothetical protein RB595_002506 [Gaeumannomyces hyphopodioides]
MPPRRTTSSSPAPSADRLVVPLQSVVLNGKDPRAEMDGVAELVIKGERQIIPGVSWTENRSGVYPTTQVMTILCGNHTLEIIDLGRFAQESAKDVLFWRVDQGFIDLTFEYPLSGSRRTSVREVPSAQGSSSQPASTHQRLRLTFASHDGFAKTCSALEVLGILRPAFRIQRPHTSQLPIAPSRPRSSQASRSASTQATAPPSHRPLLSRSEKSFSSSPHPSSPLSMTPLIGGEQELRARSMSQMPPPAGRSASPMDSQQHGSPLLRRSPYFQARPTSHASPSRPGGNITNSAVGRSRFDGVPSPYRFNPRRNLAQPQFRAPGSQPEQQGVHKSPRRVVRGAIPLSLRASIEKGLPSLSPLRPVSRTTPSHETPVSRTDAGPSTDCQMQATSAPRSIRGEETTSDVATSTFQPPVQNQPFFSSTSRLWKLFLEKSDAAMKAAEDSEEAKSQIIYECGHEFALAFNTLCGSTNTGS